MEQRYELDEITHLSSVAIGVPGKRTFFLVISTETEWVRVWIEKELLEALAVAIQQLLDSLHREGLYNPRKAPKEKPGPAPQGLPIREVEAEQITLGYDREKAILDLTIHPLGPQSLDWSELYCLVALPRLMGFGLQAKKLCEAGRPRCPRCGLPMDPEGHVCPEMN